MSTTKTEDAFKAVLAASNQGELLPEDAAKQIISAYHLELGSWIRSLRVLYPEVAANVVTYLLADLSLLSDGPQGSSSVAKQKGQQLGSKGVHVIDREICLLEALIKSGCDSLLLSQLLILARANKESKLNAATLTANLDRLVQDKIIDRPSKGRYLALKQTQVYLEALRQERKERK